MVWLSCSMVSSWYIRRDSRASMRSDSSFSDIADGVLVALAQAMTKRDTLVEHEALAAPAALGLRHLFQIFQDAALEVIDLRKSLRQQQRAGLLAADAAGAEHRDPLVPGGVKVLRGEILELTKARNS